MRLALLLLALSSVPAFAAPAAPTSPSAPTAPAAPAEKAPVKAVAPKPEEKKETPPPPVAPVKTWTNTSDTVMDAINAETLQSPIAVQVGRNGRIYRTLPIEPLRSGGLSVRVPPHSTADLWERAALAQKTTDPFSDAARFGAVPGILVGPAPVIPAAELSSTSANLTPPWQSGAATFRAYPEGDIPVIVTVKNMGIAAWVHPRVRLFAPESWKVTPPVADLVAPNLIAPEKGAKPITATSAGLRPGQVGAAAFTIRIPKSASLGQPVPLVAFFRFDVAGRSVTVQNSVDVLPEEPITRIYGMNEAGTRFTTRMINRFAPTPIGTPVVEVRKPANTDWTVTPPAPVPLVDKADAVAKISGVKPIDDQIGVPVVVTLNGLRMGYTPVVYATALYGGTGADGNPASVEKGLQRPKGAGSPTLVTADGLSFTDAANEDHTLPYDVPVKFAVSDPTVYVSPTWVTVTVLNKGAKRARLEYDSFSNEGPTLAGDLPLDPAGTETTLTFVLPDARFQQRLPDKADFRLIVSGGDVAIRRVTVSKWNPLKSSGQG